MVILSRSSRTRTYAHTRKGVQTLAKRRFELNTKKAE